jgi:hypothetical protein
MLEKKEGEIKYGQFRDIGSIGEQTVRRHSKPS